MHDDTWYYLVAVSSRVLRIIEEFPYLALHERILVLQGRAAEGAIILLKTRSKRRIDLQMIARIQEHQVRYSTCMEFLYVEETIDNGTSQIETYLLDLKKINAQKAA